MVLWEHPAAAQRGGAAAADAGVRPPLLFDLQIRRVGADHGASTPFASVGLFRGTEARLTGLAAGRYSVRVVAVRQDGHGGGVASGVASAPSAAVTLPPRARWRSFK